MIKAYEAVYKDGTFHPEEDLSSELVEGQRVRLVVEPGANETVLDLAISVYDGLTAEDINEIEHIALDRKNFFQDTP